jgi:probable addiction module antidote protein
MTTVTLRLSKEGQMTIATKLIPFEAERYFQTAEDQAELLADAIESGDAGYLAHAIGIMARARGMTYLAQTTDVRRQALYRALSKTGNPTLDTFMKVLSALDLQLKIEPKKAA